MHKFGPTLAVIATTVAMFVGATEVEAKTVCTIVADVPDGKTVLEQGDCQTRVTPASTFKVALSVMGFDNGFLKDEQTPSLPFKEGYADWGGESWRQPTDPTRWMKYSVVWYSQVITHVLGRQTLTAYATKLGFGNADFSGDPGHNNGLDRAWIMSSLKISPWEQTVFLRKLVMHNLPVSDYAMAETLNIIEVSDGAEGWHLHGKTGAAYPRNSDGTFDAAHGYGWYVGWAVRNAETYVFARLDQDEKKQTVSSGIRAREALLSEWPSLLATFAGTGK